MTAATAVVSTLVTLYALIAGAAAAERFCWWDARRQVRGGEVPSTYTWFGWRVLAAAAVGLLWPVRAVWLFVRLITLRLVHRYQYARLRDSALIGSGGQL